MSLLDAEEPRRGRGWLWAGLGVVTLAAGAAVYLSTPRDAAPEPAAEAGRPTATALDPPRRPVALDPADAPETPDPVPDDAAAEPAPEPTGIVGGAPVPATPRLRVTADVDGADVFIDRRFVGTTPLVTGDVEPGPHRVNVSAAGFEGQLVDVVITDTLTEVDIRFREVRLDTRVAVVHKHRFGECEGTLVAGLEGLRYETADDDAFTVALDDLEAFEVDYLAHNLRVAPTGGRTYNFTDRSANADALFVFHRDVEEARTRLARGDRPARPE